MKYSMVPWDPEHTLLYGSGEHQLFRELQSMGADAQASVKIDKLAE